MSGVQVSINRRYTTAVPAALGAETIVTDDRTTDSTQTLNRGNAILDIFNDPDPAAGLRYEYRLLKNGIDTGRAYFSDSMSTASEGRSKIPDPGILLESGQIQWLALQRSGALTAQSFVVVFRNGF